jgi:RimJ/RimL family protein N-acetyltransferase
MIAGMADFSVKPTLTGAKVLLRPFEEADFPAIRRALQDPETARLTGSARPAWDDVFEKRMREWYETRNLQTDRLDLAVVDRAGGGWAGEVVFNQVDERNAACNFRVLLGPDARDRGLGSEAIRLFVAYGFEQLALHRIALEVYAFNPRARRVYEKVGFRPEGVLRDAIRTEDGWADSTVMAILAPDWAQVQQG